MISPHALKPLNLQFKGDRNYLHGSDIYTTVTQWVSVFANDPSAYVNKIVFRHLARHDCDLLMDRPAESIHPIADGTYRLADGSDAPYWVVESERPVGGRYAFDEDTIVSSALFDDRLVLMTQRTAYSPIEEIIAMNKALNYRLMPKVSGKWLFGQLTLKHALRRDCQKIKISMRSAISGRYSVSDIDIDEKPAGEIRFVVGRP